MKRTLDDVDAVACTTDLWSSISTQASYITVTAHFLVGSEMKTAVLDTKHLPLEHTAQNIAATLRAILQDYGVEDRVSGFVTDNGANVNQTCENIGSPLHVLAKKHDALGVRYLLEHGADATLMDDKGNLALHYAIQSRDIRVIEALCGDGFPEGRIGVCGDVAQTAGQLNDWMFMRALSDFGARVDALDFSPDGPYKNRHWVLRDFSRGRPPDYDLLPLLNIE